MTKTIKLQSIGTVNAVQAGELTAGDVTVWNFGATETILKKTKETAKTVWFKIKSDGTGTIHTRQMKKTRLVGLNNKN